MSIGLARLREEPERIRQGAIDKGEAPSIVDQALGLEGRRRELLQDSDRLNAERNSASKKIGDAIRGGAAPNGPEVAELRAASTKAGEQVTITDAELAAGETALEDLPRRTPTPADPDVPIGDESANQVVRTWGEVLPREEALPSGAPRNSRPHREVAEFLPMFD